MNYELKLEQYSGPLEKLLELIEERKLEVTEISLGQVTEDFLRHLNDLKAKTGALQEGDPVEHSVRAHLRLLVDFIIVASRLILIKSKSLLPGLELSGEEEADIKDLERRLFIYKELKPAMRLIASLWKSPHGSFHALIF
jgi:segregation and condensation protein A